MSASITRKNDYLENKHLMFYKIISKMARAFEKDKYIYNQQLCNIQDIDITENPLIAPYFSCEDKGEVDGEIFVYEAKEEEILNFESEELRCFEKISMKRFKKLCEDFVKKEECKKEKIKKSYIVQGVAQNERVNNQSGNFIFVWVASILMNIYTYKTYNNRQ